MTRPLAIDLFCGLFGWSEGLTQEGWRTVGYDIEDMHANFGLSRPPHCEIIIQDVLTLHGSQFKDAMLIVASPPCQEWSLAKAKAKAIRADMTGKELERLNRLFNACFRIQKEASFAAGRVIPLIVENVKGAQPWVGRSRWAFGSFHLWGDVPALMPATFKGVKVGMGSWRHPDDPRHVPGLGFNTHADRNLRDGIKNTGGSWFAIAHNTTSGKGQNPDGRKVPSAEGRRTDIGKGARFTSRDCGFEAAGIKCGGDWFNQSQPSISRQTSSKSPARKMASALIAKIPLPLSRHIEAVFR